MGDRSGNKSTSSTGQWPLIKPKKNLKANFIKDTDLFTVREFLSPEESKAFVRATEAIGFAHQGSLGPTHGEAYRDNGRISVEDPHLANAMLYANKQKIEKAIDEAIAWLDGNQLAEVEEFEDRQKELEGLCNPVISKMYQGGEVAMGGGAGMPGGGCGSGNGNGSTGAGPKIEEVD